MKKVLVYGYGNPGRQDDGLGVELAEKIEIWAKEQGISNLETDSNYQLNIEDADRISEFDEVVFADASIEAISDFVFTDVLPDDSRIEFTMHAVSPSFVLDMCMKIYGRKPEVKLLHIKGYEFELQEGITETAKENLEKSFAFLKDYILKIISHV